MNLNATIIGQAIAFAIFVWFCMKFVWPPLITVLQQRQQKIADSIENARKAQQRLENADNEAQKTIEQAKDQSADLIKQAHERASTIVDNAKVEANEQAGKIIQQASDNLQTARNKIKDELRTEMGELVVQSVEQVLGNAVSADIDKKFIEQAISKV